MAIAWNTTNGVAEEREMHDLWYAYQRLDVIPVADVVVVKIEELQLTKSSKYFCWWQAGDCIIAEIDLLQVTEALQIHQVFLLNEVALQVGNSQILALAQGLETASELLITERDDSYFLKRITFSQSEE